MRSKFDRDVCIVTLAAALVLAGASVFSPATQAQTPSTSTHIQTAPTTLASSSGSRTIAVSDDDDDGGDELMEHWTDPTDIREQHYQLAGMMLMFAITAGVVVHRKRKIRRLVSG
jgi:hypothetical protein